MDKQILENTLYQKLSEHQEKGFSSFHTPGHKCTGFFPSGLIGLDLTELPDTDALYECEGVILGAEKKLAALFNAQRTMISAGGCTLAIQAMLRIASLHGRKILFARNIHRSAVNTCALLGIEPVWAMPASASPFFTGRVSPDEIETAFRAHKNISACYITSPDYYGEISDIKSIAQICHRHDALLLVDNAHGSHLAFMKSNMHPIALGADMTACSMHKTLPVLTGGAVLNFADASLAAHGKQAMALFGSTSPSYPIMASIDLCRSWLVNGGAEKYAALGDRIAEIKHLAASLGITMPDGLCDPLRVCINTSLCGISGQEQTDFFHSYLIEPEFCDGSNAVFICTPFNSETDLQRLEAAVRALAAANRTAPPAVPLTLPQKILEPREALLSECITVPTKNAVGHISADSACPCPPGIPIVMPGELIDERICSSLLSAGIYSVNVVSRDGTADQRHYILSNNP